MNCCDATMGRRDATSAGRNGSDAENVVDVANYQHTTSSDSRRGQVLVLVALAMVALLGLAALAADVGAHFANRSYLQTIADAAALAGGQVLTQTQSITQAEQTALTYIVTNTTKVDVPSPPLASAGGALVYDGGGTTPDHLVWGIRADASTGAVWVAVTNTVRFSFARLLGFRTGLAIARGVAYTPGGTTRLTSWLPLATPTPVRCAAPIGSIPLSDSNQGYYYTFNTTAPGTISAQWTLDERNDRTLAVYVGNPFAGQPNPVRQSPPSGWIARRAGSGMVLSVSTSSRPAGQYTVYFYDQGKEIAGASSGVVTYMKTPCP